MSVGRWLVDVSVGWQLIDGLLVVGSRWSNYAKVGVLVD